MASQREKRCARIEIPQPKEGKSNRNTFRKGLSKSINQNKFIIADPDFVSPCCSICGSRESKMRECGDAEHCVLMTAQSPGQLHLHFGADKDKGSRNRQKTDPPLCLYGAPAQTKFYV